MIRLGCNQTSTPSECHVHPLSYRQGHHAASTHPTAELPHRTTGHPYRGMSVSVRLDGALARVGHVRYLSCLSGSSINQALPSYSLGERMSVSRRSAFDGHGYAAVVAAPATFCSTRRLLHVLEFLCCPPKRKAHRRTAFTNRI